MHSSTFTHWARRMVFAVIVLFAACAPTRAGLLNPSFEGLFEHWSGDCPAAFGWQARSDWVTDGAWSMVLFSDAGGTFEPGDCCRMYQTLDLTSYTEIQVDVKLSAWEAGSPQVFDHVKAALLLDGQEFWSANVGGTYLDTTIDVAHLAGNHTLEFRNEATDAETFSASYWTQWDNFRTVPEPATLGLVLAGASLSLCRRRLNRAV